MVLYSTYFDNNTDEYQVYFNLYVRIDIKYIRTTKKIDDSWYVEVIEIGLFQEKWNFRNITWFKQW